MSRTMERLESLEPTFVQRFERIAMIERFERVERLGPVPILLLT
jgi:hypothetical protein